MNQDMTKFLYQRQDEGMKWLQDTTLMNTRAFLNVTCKRNSILISGRNAGLHIKPEYKDSVVLHTGASRDVTIWYLATKHQKSARDLDKAKKNSCLTVNYF